MIKGFQRFLHACLLLFALTACDGIPQLGPIKESHGTLEGHPTSSFVVYIDSESGKSLGSGQLRSAMEVVVGRLGELQVEDFQIERRDDTSLLLKVREVGEDAANAIKNGLEKVARLELHKVSERNDELGPDGRTLAQRVLDGDELVVGQKAYLHQYVDYEGNKTSRPILLYRRAAITTSDIARAMPSPQQPDAVSITLSNEGGEKMVALTQDMRPGIDRIAIVLNDEVVSAPVVAQVPLSKNFMVEGLHEPGEAESLAADLMHPTGKPFRVELID